MELYMYLLFLLFFVAAGLFTLFAVQFKRGAGVVNYLVNFTLTLMGLGLILTGVYFFIFRF